MYTCPPAHTQTHKYAHIHTHQNEKKGEEKKKKESLTKLEKQVHFFYAQESCIALILDRCEPMGVPHIYPDVTKTKSFKVNTEGWGITWARTACFACTR